MSSKLNPPRPADPLVSRLKALIDDRKLQAGMRLPAERQLAAELGVSRSSLREAIQQLISVGMLVSRRGDGTRLREQIALWTDLSIVEPLRQLVEDDPDYRYDILEARHAIEASTAWYAALRATEADKEQLQYAFDATLKLKDSDDPALAAQADVRFHLAIAVASHNLVLLQTMRGFFDLMQTSVLQSRQRMYSQPVIFSRLTDQHHALLQAIVGGDAEAARQAAMTHLGFVHDTMRSLHEDEARQQRLMRLPGNVLKSHKEGEE
ncbi:transcriptional regulator LldR [Winslowiella iniecta]|uniref:Transcriptional regulator n=1 Tax=Winslowiella iniecta TaxID=1560201 RepID=A0A0L7T972_9GAMM|nr:transcriptional regulator LldR [Winslowiella iniecta]KOC91919.1 transcriptional regulator [Winslowiella iniecta]KOC94958.1 transcriptional regulator [Winslowiella iniecta]